MDKLSEQLMIRLNQTDLAALTKAAKADGMKRSVWARRALMLVVKRGLRVSIEEKLSHG